MMYLAWPPRGNLTFATLCSPLTSWSCRFHSVLKFGRSWILLIGPVGFALTMACSASIVYLTIAKSWIQSSVRCIFLELILGFTGVDLADCCDQTMVGSWFLFLLLAVESVSLYSCLWCLMVCVGKIKRSLYFPYILAVIRVDLYVLEVGFKINDCW